MPNSYFLVGWPGLVGPLPGLAGPLPGFPGCPGFHGCPGFIAIEIHLLSLSNVCVVTAITLPQVKCWL